MSDTLNVFEHQRFRLVRPDGERVERSFRDLLTGPDEPLRFAYGQEYLNVAAFGLCVALAQAAFEPESVDEAEDRLAEPITEGDFDDAVRDLRGRFTINGPPGTRFLQGRPPKTDKKGRATNLKGLTELLPTTNTRQAFLNRPDAGGAVRLDQVPLLLFGRHTFYEKSAGRGYLTGTSGDLEVRTYLLDRGRDGAGSLRRSIWLNVLSRNEQREGFYGDEVDGWMWTDDRERYPAEVGRGSLALRAGLLWMVADTWVVIGEPDEARRCVVTGEEIGPGERAGLDVAVQATGIGFGTKASADAGRDSFFLHPAAPYKLIQPKKGTAFHVHLQANETSGLYGEAAGLFFAQDRAGSHHVAPALSQLYELDDRPPVDLLAFGFQMVGAKANVHGGYVAERFRYPSLETEDALGQAQGLVERFVGTAGKIEDALTYAVQLCLHKKVDVLEEEVSEGGDRRIALKLTIDKKNRLRGDSLGRDIAQAFWSDVGDVLREVLALLDGAGRGGNLTHHVEAIETWAVCAAAWHARELFRPVFDAHSLSPIHLVGAHRARGFLARTLNETVTGELPSRRPAPPEIVPA